MINKDRKLGYQYLFHRVINIVNTSEFIMPVKGFTWNEEYRKKFYDSEKVKDHLDNFVKQASQPKTEAQKTKMSIAKTGRKYSQEHKDNMSETHKFRQALKKEILTKYPEMPADELWKQVRARMEE